MSADSRSVIWVTTARFPKRSDTQAMASGPTKPAPCNSVRNNPPTDAETSKRSMKKGTR